MNHITHNFSNFSNPVDFFQNLVIALDNFFCASLRGEELVWAGQAILNNEAYQYFQVVGEDVTEHIYVLGVHHEDIFNDFATKEDVHRGIDFLKDRFKGIDGDGIFVKVPDENIFFIGISSNKQLH